MSGDHEDALSVEEIEAMNRREAIRRGVDPGPREHEFAGLGDAALQLGNTMFKDRLQPRPDEMAAGLIHEPGTGGDPIDWNRSLDEQVRDIPIEREAMDDERDRDHCGYVEADADGGNAEFAEVEDGTETELAMYQRFYAASARDHMEARAMIEDLHAESTKMTAQLQAVAQQRDFLMGQVDSLVQRLAGAHVAAGSFNMAAAQGFVLKESMPINNALAQIAAQTQGEDQ